MPFGDDTTSERKHPQTRLGLAFSICEDAGQCWNLRNPAAVFFLLNLDFRHLILPARTFLLAEQHIEID